MTFSRTIVAALFAGLVFVTSSSVAFAFNASDVDKEMRNAQNLYFKGMVQEADEALKKAEEMAGQITAGSDAQEKEKVKRLEGRLKKLREDIGRKLGKTAKSGPERAAPERAPAGPVEGSGTLPSHVISDLKVVDRYIASAQQSLDSGDIRNARRSIVSAQDKLQQTLERQKRHLTPDHPQYRAFLARIQEVDAGVSAVEHRQAEQRASADQTAAKAKAESEKWVAKLKPYVTGPGQPGYDPESHFIPGYTEDQKEMAKRGAIFGKVASEMAAYRAGGPGDKATEELQLLVRNIEHDLKTFEESSKSMAELKVKEAGRQIDYILTWLSSEEKKIGTKDMPRSMNKGTFESARRDLDGAARLLGEDDGRVKALEVKYGEALALDAKLAKARVSQTRMIPDKFAGPELAALKKKAGGILGEVSPGIKVLRTTIVSDDWKEENVIEWTDTTRSALRHRVTHSVSAQVAGKLKGETTLYTLHIAKDRRVDGSWSPLGGHIMFKDPILEENVER